MAAAMTLVTGVPSSGCRGYAERESVLRPAGRQVTWPFKCLACA